MRWQILLSQKQLKPQRCHICVLFLSAKDERGRVVVAKLVRRYRRGGSLQALSWLYATEALQNIRTDWVTSDWARSVGFYNHTTVVVEYSRQIMTRNGPSYDHSTGAERLWDRVSVRLPTLYHLWCCCCLHLKLAQLFLKVEHVDDIAFLTRYRVIALMTRQFPDY